MEWVECPVGGVNAGTGARGQVGWGEVNPVVGAGVGWGSISHNAFISRDPGPNSRAGSNEKLMLGKCMEPPRWPRF
jgi:hypothetical protein